MFVVKHIPPAYVDTDKVIISDCFHTRAKNAEFEW